MGYDTLLVQTELNRLSTRVQAIVSKHYIRQPLENCIKQWLNGNLLDLLHMISGNVLGDALLIHGMQPLIMYGLVGKSMDMVPFQKTVSINH